MARPPVAAVPLPLPPLLRLLPRSRVCVRVSLFSPSFTPTRGPWAPLRAAEAESLGVLWPWTEQRGSAIGEARAGDTEGPRAEAGTARVRRGCVGHPLLRGLSPLPRLRLDLVLSSNTFLRKCLASSDPGVASQPECVLHLK